ncbi:MAG: MBL fold metallo-hydrolase [Candidatus Bathyarchaeia archaeon]
MCAQVQTKDVNILIDPGLASEVDSFPLSSRLRTNLYNLYKERIIRTSRDSDIIIITHYHYDHYISERSRELYEDKILLLKDPSQFINKSQRTRALHFLEMVKGLPKKVKTADRKTFRIGATTINFSRPLWHGVENTSLGYVIMAAIRAEGEKLVYSSDVNGLILEEPTRTIIGEDPDSVILDGPPTYLLGYVMAYYNLARSIINICRLLDKVTASPIILDHHVVRDYRYQDLLYEVYRKAEDLRKPLCTAAELEGRKTMVLEGYNMNGPTRWRRWRRFDRNSMEAVIRNAIKNRLISRRWIKMLNKL